MNNEWLKPYAIIPVDIPTTGILIAEIKRLRSIKTNMHNWEVSIIVYALRLLADNLDKKPRTTQEQEILDIAYEALLVAPREIHELVNILESNDNYE